MTIAYKWRFLNGYIIGFLSSFLAFKTHKLIFKLMDLFINHEQNFYLKTVNSEQDTNVLCK